MRQLMTLMLLSALCILPCQPLLAQVDDSAARKDQILANLQLVYPQLRSATVVMGEITASGYAALDKGSLTVDGEPQDFLVAADNTQLYMIARPIDVSRDAARIAAEERASAAARDAELRALARGRPFRGNAKAPVLIVEFADFQCPYCARAKDTVDKIVEKYPDDVKLVFMHMPLDFHPWAMPAAIAAECAAAQGADAFWTLHDGYFANQANVTVENVVDSATRFLEGSTLDMERWSECTSGQASPAHVAAAAAVAASKEKGSDFGVSGTPGFFVNGIAVNGAQPLEVFDEAIENAKRAAADG